LPLIIYMNQRFLHRIVQICLLIVPLSFSQQPGIIREGIWEVKSVRLSDQFEYDESTRSGLMQIASALEGSRLHLNGKGKARFETKVPQLYVAEARWTYDESTGTLRLADQRDAANILMEFLVATGGENTLFYLAESPFVFEMKHLQNE